MKVAYCDISPLYLYTVHAAIICYVNRSLFRTDTWFVKYCRRVDLLQMNDSQHGNILCKSLFSLSLCLSLSLAPWFYIPTLRIGLCSRGSLALQSIELIDLIIQRFLPCLVQCNATATAVFFGKRRTHTQRICSHNVFSWPKMIRWHDITFHVHSMYHIMSGSLYRGSLLMAPQQTWKNLGHRPLWPGSKCTARWDMMGLTCQIGFKLFPKSRRMQYRSKSHEPYKLGINWIWLWALHHSHMHLIDVLILRQSRNKLMTASWKGAVPGYKSPYTQTHLEQQNLFCSWTLNWGAVADSQGLLWYEPEAA